MTKKSKIGYRPSRYIGWYLGFTDISVSANVIGFNRNRQNAVTFLMHPDNLRKKAQHSKSRQLSYNNASRCGFINKQTRLTVEHASAVTPKTKASSGSFAMLGATRYRCCVQINSCYTSGSFRSSCYTSRSFRSSCYTSGRFRKSLTGT